MNGSFWHPEWPGKPGEAKALWGAQWASQQVEAEEENTWSLDRAPKTKPPAMSVFWDRGQAAVLLHAAVSLCPGVPVYPMGFEVLPVWGIQ